MFGASFAAAATLTLPPDAGASPGFTVVVGLSIDDAAGMLGTDLVVTYDPAVVTATAVTTTGVSASHALTHNLAPAGMIRISLFGTTPLSGSGSLLAITIEAVGPPGSRTVLRRRHRRTGPGPRYRDDPGLDHRDVLLDRSALHRHL